MRIVQVTERFPPALGGVEAHVAGLSRRLAQAGHRVEVVTTDLARTRPFTRLTVSEDGFPFAVTRLRAIKFAELTHGLGVGAPGMVPHILRAEAEVIHAHAYGHFPTYAGAAARLLRGTRLVLTPHADRGRASVSKRAFDRVVPPLTLRRASRVIALTRHEAAYLEELGVPSDRIVIIPNGVDLAEFESVPRDRPAGAGLSVLFVGRLDPEQKGLDTMVRALALLPESLGVRLRVAGEDWGGASLVRSLANAVGLSSRVALLGPLDRVDLLREYAHADVLVLPSSFEPFGIVLLEAMAAGLPVVASTVGGIPEIVEDGRSGLLVPPGDPEALAGAIARLAADDTLRRSMGRRGLDHVASYSWDTVAPRILRVYEDALEERGS